MKIKKNDPILMSMERLEMNLHKLKQIGPHGNANSLWETAGHIWGATYWICELTKDAKLINDAWNIRLALSHIIGKNHHIDGDLSTFDIAILKITESCKKIEARVTY